MKNINNENVGQIIYKIKRDVSFIERKNRWHRELIIMLKDSNPKTKKELKHLMEYISNKFFDDESSYVAEGKNNILTFLICLYKKIEQLKISIVEFQIYDYLFLKYAYKNILTFLNTRNTK